MGYFRRWPACDAHAVRLDEQMTVRRSHIILLFSLRSRSVAYVAGSRPERLNMSASMPGASDEVCTTMDGVKFTIHL